MGLQLQYILLVLFTVTIVGLSLHNDAYATGGTISDSASCVAIGGTWTSPNYCSAPALTVANGETLTVSSGIILDMGGLTNQGTVENGGDLHSLGVNNYGTFNNHGHESAPGFNNFFNHVNAVVTNDGNLEVVGSEQLVNQGTINNLSTGTIDDDTRSRGIYNYGILTNDGTLNKAEAEFYNQAGGTLTNNGIMTSYGVYNSFWNNGGNFINNGKFTTQDGFARFNSGTFTNNGTLIATAINAGDQYTGFTINGGTFTNNANGLIINDVTLNNNIGAALANNGIVRNECNSIYDGNEPTPNPALHIACPTVTISASGTNTTGSPVSTTANVVGGVAPFTYSWNFILYPAGSHVAFSNPDSATASFTPDLAGNYWMQVTIKDSEFVQQTTSAQVTIPIIAAPVDTTAPVVTVPQLITVSAAGPSGVVVTFATSATDPDDTAGPVQCDHASGSTFAIGTTQVTCTSTDTHSNTGSASFTVTVKDTVPPVLTLPSPITASATGSSGAAVTYSASATDDVDGTDAVSCTPASGSTFAIGTTTVICSSTDAAGNTATGSFTVTVKDTTPPVVTVPSSITVPPTSPSGATLTFATSAADPDDAAGPVQCDHASGSTFSIGITSVTCTSTDTHSNTGSASFTVTVQTPQQALQSLITLKESMGLPNGLTTSLDAKLSAASDSLNLGDDKTAKNQLNAFISEVNAQTGKQITQVQANQLVSGAQNIINSIS